MRRGYFRLTSPCAACPFRNDIAGYLSEERVWNIEGGLAGGGFPCHKTTEFDDDGEYIDGGKREAHCAGALILLEKLERPSQLMRVAERIGMYDASRLAMDAPVYDSFDEMAAAQPVRTARTMARSETRRPGARALLSGED